jgi:hypothetical protein
MNLIDVAAQVSAVITLVALGWLTLRAFAKHPGWGLAVLLFSPPGAVAFGHRYWKEVSRPLLLYLGAFVVTLALALTLFSAWGGWELLRSGVRVHQGMQSNTLANRDAGHYLRANLAFAEKSGLDIHTLSAAEYARRQLVRDALAAAQEAAAQEAAETATGEPAGEVPYHDMRKKVKVNPDAGFRRVYIPIDVSEAHKFIGATVKVTRRNVREKEYRLAGVRGNRLQFTQRNRSGSFSFSFRTRDIEKLRVLVKQPK